MLETGPPSRRKGAKKKNHQKPFRRKVKTLCGCLVSKCSKGQAANTVKTTNPTNKASVMRFPFVNEKGVWKHVAYISWVCPKAFFFLIGDFRLYQCTKFINDDLRSNVWKNPFSDKQLGESKKRCVLRCRLLQPRNLVETKSVLDCCRISRNFSRKKEVNKKDHNERERKKQKKSFKPFFNPFLFF